MKKMTASTFVLNRNDKQYFFVEGKNHKIYGPSYHVYYKKDEKPVFFKAKNFYEVHGLDEKQKVSSFIYQALLNLRLLYGTSNEANYTYEKLYNIYTILQKASADKKVNLSSTVKKDLVEVIEIYNQIKDSFSEDIMIPFEENYQLVTSNETNELIETREYDSFDNDMYMNEYRQNRAVQRVLKQ